MNHTIVLLVPDNTKVKQLSVLLYVIWYLSIVFITLNMQYYIKHFNALMK